MDTNQPIELFQLKPITIPKQTNAKLFKPATGVKGFFQKLAWKFLSRTKSLHEYWDETETVEKLRINRKSVREKIMDPFFRSFPYSKPTKIYLGPEEFDEILYDRHNEDIINMLSFNMQEPLYTGYNDSLGINRVTKSIMNLEVFVVPHMKGVLIV